VAVGRGVRGAGRVRRVARRSAATRLAPGRWRAALARCDGAIRRIVRLRASVVRLCRGYHAGAPWDGASSGPCPVGCYVGFRRLGSTKDLISYSIRMPEIARKPRSQACQRGPSCLTRTTMDDSAERVGFEPTEELNTPHLLSRKALSTGLSHLSSWIAERTACGTIRNATQPVGSMTCTGSTPTRTTRGCT
jgi:hypothetical protein